MLSLGSLPRPTPSLPTDPALYSGPFPFYRRPSRWAASPWMHSASTMEMLARCGYYSLHQWSAPTLTSRDGYPDRYQPQDERGQEVGPPATLAP